MREGRGPGPAGAGGIRRGRQNKSARRRGRPCTASRAEIWDALKASCEADLATARLIVESAGVIVTTEDMSVCYDEQGGRAGGGAVGRSGRRLGGRAGRRRAGRPLRSFHSSSALRMVPSGLKVGSPKLARAHVT